MNLAYLGIIPALPLTGAVLNAFFGRRIGKVGVSVIGVGSVLAAFIFSAWALPALLSPSASREVHVLYYNWITAGNFSANVSFLYDPLSAIMLMVVTGVGFLIHVYATGYMAHDEEYARFFSYLNLFVFSMLLLVLADNFLLLYAGWELVGLCSFLLIGFWFTRDAARSAAVKAFVTTRIGDLFFSLGIILIWITFGTLAYADVFGKAPAMFSAGAPVITVITLLLFAGAVGKSAQIPLYVWLPDAMEGPTPVSALIHAATMVTAGVYMVARAHALFDLAPATLQVVAVIGTATAFFAASLALVQTDLKRVLAYSTISQLGYMFLGTGVAAYGAAIFHLMTHAFFKALLFLAAGSVMHAMNDVIDMRKLGGLGRVLGFTFFAFFAGALALAGFPFTSGFFSKDSILASVLASGNIFLYAVGLLTASLTAFYIFRAFFLTFFGEPRWEVVDTPEGRQPAMSPEALGSHTTHKEDLAPHEAPFAMAWPLMALAVLALIGGAYGLPAVLGENGFGAFVASALGRGEVSLDAGREWLVLSLSALASLVGIGLAYWFYVADPSKARALAAAYPGVYRLLVHKYYVDEIYDTLFVRPGRALAGWLWTSVDVWVIDGAVNGVAGFFQNAGSGLRRAQMGYARAYAAAMLLGIVVVIAVLVIR